MKLIHIADIHLGLAAFNRLDPESGMNLGVKDITLGPKLPAFVLPGVLNVLVENFGIIKNSTIEDDLARMVPA
jgi:hydroxylamine reductase (hybrid-cluster protein)